MQMQNSLDFQTVTLPNTIDPFKFMHEVQRQIEHLTFHFKKLNLHFYDEVKEDFKSKVFTEFSWLVHHIFLTHQLNFSKVVKNGQIVVNLIPGLLQQEIFFLGMFGSWRIAPNIFEIDPDVLLMVNKSPLPLNAPMSVFDKIPFWAVYVKLPTHQLQVNVTPEGGCIDMDCYGFWAYKLAIKDEIKLCIFPHYSNFELTRNAQHLIPGLILPLSENVTIQQAVDSFLASTDFMQNKDFYIVNVLRKNLLIYTRQYLSSLLMLCVEEPQITTLPNKAGEASEVDLTKLDVTPPIHKKTKLFVPPSVPKHYMVAQRLGRQIRDFITREQKIEGTGSVKPHIRQAHWHSYRCGANRQDFKLNFLAPIFVNFSSE